MEREIVINQSLSEEKLLKASTQILLSGRIFIYLLILFIVILLNTIGSTYINEEVIDVFSFFQCAIPFIVAVIVFYAVKKAVRKNYKKNTRYFLNVTLSFTDDTFKTEGKDFQNSMPWGNYKKIKETKDWFLIYMNQNQAQMVDKTALSEQQIQELKILFRTLPPKVKVYLK